MKQTKIVNSPANQGNGLFAIHVGKGKKRNRNPKQESKSLMDEMRVEIKKVPLLVCKQPKTYKMIPCDWSQEQKDQYIASHFDENGKFIFETAPDRTILQ